MAPNANSQVNPLRTSLGTQQNNPMGNPNVSSAVVGSQIPSNYNPPAEMLGMLKGAPAGAFAQTNSILNNNYGIVMPDQQSQSNGFEVLDFAPSGNRAVGGE